MNTAPRAPLQPTTHDVTARGTRIRFTEVGDGPAVILLHDFLQSRRRWEPLAERLASRMRVIAPDLPGFGESEKPRPSRYGYGFTTFAESIVDIVGALGLGRVSFCGHGLGGSVALALASNHADVVDRLVLLAPIVYPSPPRSFEGIAAWPLLGGVFFKQFFGRTLFTRLSVRAYDGKPPAGALARIAHDFEHFDTPAAREAAYATMTAMRDTRSLVARLPRVKAPALIVRGSGDPAFGIEQARQLARALPRARLEVVDGGHSPAEESPERVSELALDFLAPRLLSS